MNKNQVKGATHESTGKVKEKIGRIPSETRRWRTTASWSTPRASIQKAAVDFQSKVKKATT